MVGGLQIWRRTPLGAPTHWRGFLLRPLETSSRRYCKMALKLNRAMAETMLRFPGDLAELIVMEIYRRGGAVRVGTGRRPGPDRDLYETLGAAMNLSSEERKRTFFDAGTESERNCWDYNMLAAVARLRQGRGRPPSITTGTPVGTWQLTLAGRQWGKQLAETQPAIRSAQRACVSQAGS